MLLMMTAPAPSRFRPLPDPPPCKLFWFESLSPTIPPDPPDPPDASSVLALFRFLNAAASLSSHAFPKIQDLESHSPILTSKMRGGDTHHLSVGVSSFVSGRRCTAGCSLLYHRRTVWSPFRSCPDVLFQIEETLSMIFLLLKPVETSTFLLGVSCLEQSIFLIFPHVWSELDEQALLVLQGFSSQLVHFSAFEAVIVTLWVTLDAICQKAYEIVVMQFLWHSFYNGSMV
ncbi:PREDICTED: uncharacterized protein LOC106302883 [Brassica oleracea var. oleracea]|uniref:uncharacterized protein LOC106302883 n=1 Tax=Brassica oleracea var. oleracea TaxID=109376 RepID=UPI0006A6DB19|nr:PREDICTED: uncharacterized protein LOC106302883 [Brassica oleracea var. oleracea]